MRRLPILLLTLLTTVLFASPALAAPRAGTPLGGGSRLHGSGDCTAAFATTNWYLVVGQGCGPAGTTVTSGANVLVGSITATTPSGVGIVHVTNHTDWTMVGWVGGAGTITGSTAAPVGAATCLIGPGTGVHCGTITARNVTVNFPGGVVTGLARTTVCADPGGTAVTFVAGTQAQGVLVGASGTCTSGGTTYFDPINPILATYGLTLLT